MREPPVEVRSANWLELFYDLVFAAAVITFSDAVSGNPAPSVIGTVSLAFVAVWLVWLATTLYVNAFGIDDAVHRVLIIAQMLLLTLSSLAVGDGLGQNSTLASLSFALLVLDVGVMYGRHARRPGGSRAFAQLRRNQYFIAAVPVIFAAFLGPAWRDVLWPLGLLLLAVPTLGFRFGALAKTMQLREDHLVERLGLLTIIMMGEAFVKVALVVQDGHLDGIDVVVLVALFAMMFAIWWSYFDAIPDAGIRAGRAAGLWLIGHVAFQWCLVGVAVAYAKWLSYDTLNSFTGERSLLGTVPFAGFLLTLLLIGLCTRRTPYGPLAWLRGLTALAVVVLGVVYWRVDGADVQTAAISLAVIALLEAALASVLQRRTMVQETVTFADGVRVAEGD